jgi:methylisocitrate lyase
MSQTASAAAVLRGLVAEETIQIPGAPLALMGRLIERFGYRATYLSGAATSAGTFAMPDVGLFTLTELVQQTNYLTRATSLPVIVDADTGFGDAIHVERTVRELEIAGAAAIQLEDQQLPKRCGHLSGKSLVSVEAMCAKVRAATAARDNPDTIIIARTDARGVEGLDAAIGRAVAYMDAGADWIFPEALTSEAEFIEFRSQISVPLLANMTEFGKSPLLNFQFFKDNGYAAVLYPVTLLRVAMKAAEAALGILDDEGTQESMLDLMQTRAELYDLLDYDGLEARDRDYAGN